MVDIFVDSNAAGAANGTSFADAFTSILDPVPSVGDRILIADNHSESLNSNNAPMPAAYTPVDPAQPVAVLSVDTTTLNLSTGASISQSQPSRLTHGYIWYGVSFSAANFDQWQNSASSDGRVIFRECTFTKTGGGAAFTAAGDFHWTFYDTTFNVNGTGGLFDLDREGHIIMHCCTATGTAAQNITTFNSDGVATLHLEWDSCDFSGLASATNDLINITAEANVQGRIYNCRLPTGMDIIDRTTGNPGFALDLECIFTDDGSTTDPRVNIQQHTSFGLTETDTTRVRTGGASDGTTDFSWRMTLDANATPIPAVFGHRSPSMSIYVEGGTATTITVNVAHDGIGDGTAGDLTDQEFWISGDRPDSATPSFAAGGLISTVSTGTATDLANNAAVWSGTGVGTTQEASITFTPAESGYVNLRAYFAPVDQTGVSVNIDPLIVVT